MRPATRRPRPAGRARGLARRRRRRRTPPPTRWPRRATPCRRRHHGGVLGRGHQHRDGHGALHRRRSPGQSHTVTATGPVMVIAGAPGASRPRSTARRSRCRPGNQAPFTLKFETARQRDRLGAGATAPADERRGRRRRAGRVEPRLGRSSLSGQPEGVEQEGEHHGLLLPGVVAAGGPAVAGPELGLEEHLGRGRSARSLATHLAGSQ